MVVQERQHSRDKKSAGIATKGSGCQVPTGSGFLPTARRDHHCPSITGVGKAVYPPLLRMLPTTDVLGSCPLPQQLQFLQLSTGGADDDHTCQLQQASLLTADTLQLQLSHQQMVGDVEQFTQQLLRTVDDKDFEGPLLLARKAVSQRFVRGVENAKDREQELCILRTNIQWEKQSGLHSCDVDNVMQCPVDVKVPVRGSILGFHLWYLDNLNDMINHLPLACGENRAKAVMLFCHQCMPTISQVRILLSNHLKPR